MENASKALSMVANLLLAVIILSLVLYFYNLIRTLPIEEESQKIIEQAQEFNKQFEVYDKRIMYGVDVVSALNKAISNNEKYITGSWLSGALSPTEFGIDIVVVLKETETGYGKSPLKEEIVVKYYDIDEYGKYIEKEYTNDKGPSGGLSFSDLLSFNTSPKFLVPSNEYMKLYGDTIKSWSNIELKTQEIQLDNTLPDEENAYKGDRYMFSLFPDGEINKPAIADDDIYLKYLCEGLSTFTSSSGQTVYNKQYAPGTNTINIKNGGWSSLTWTPAITDLKTRKFRCEAVDENGKPNGEPGIEYNEKTGAICKITFVEYGLN